MDNPLLVVTLGTTGLPSEDFKPATIAIGCRVVLPDGAVAGEPGTFVRVLDPFDSSAELEAHMALSRVQFALKMNQITAADVLASPGDSAVAKALGAWLKDINAIMQREQMYMARWVSYNAEFAADVLPESLRAVLPPMGPDCLMLVATGILHAHGAARTKRNGEPMYVGLKRTVQWLQGRGHAVPEPDGTVAGNLRAASYVCAALDIERDRLPETTMGDMGALNPDGWNEDPDDLDLGRRY